MNSRKHVRIRRLALPVLTLLACLILGSAAADLTIKAGRVNPFVPNILTVKSDEPGLLTIRVEGRMNAVTALPVEAGTTEVTWRALSWNDEPLLKGNVRLTAELTLADGSVRTAECTANVRLARAAVLYCLPEHDRYAIGGAPLRVEVGVSEKGRVRVELVSAKEGAAPVWVSVSEIAAGNTEHMLIWDWRRPKAELVPGEYRLRAWTLACPEQLIEVPLTLTENRETSGELFLTGSLIPGDPDDDAAVWAALCAPVVVGDGGEGSGLHLYTEPDPNAPRAGSVNCATVCLTVLDLSDEKWAKVGAWVQRGGEYVEGYVLKKKLKTVEVNCRYGVLVDKNTQTLRVYEDGHCIGSAVVSTGYQIGGKYLTNSETRAGAYLVGTRWTRFSDGGFTYQYPIRIDGLNLIHQVGWRTKQGVPAGFAEQHPLLGQKVSHGCIRVDCLPGEDGGINAYWLWTHLGHNTKILIIDDPEVRHARMDEMGMEY
ncbi:MAG: L,D-transpeptidase [Clostridia bacterium]|nr:L,D-transpeptidase [Clostridia bacterium]MBR4459756.1 L,D-transpeptidase [Clostridia bacterium]